MAQRFLKLFFGGCLVAGGVLAQEVPPTPSETATQKVPLMTKNLILRGLDKVTGHVQMLEATLGEEVRFGKLRITARACRKSLPEDPPESIAYLDIQEDRGGNALESVFSGWMFASTPSISAMEHPVYDVWVVACQGASAHEDKETAVSVHSLGVTHAQDPAPGLASVPDTTSPSSESDHKDTSATSVEEKDQLDAFYQGLNQIEDMPTDIPDLPEADH